MLKSFLLFFAVVLFAVVCVSQQGGSGQQPAPAPALTPPQTVAPTPATAVKNPVRPTAESQAKAKNLYQIDCAMCHGDNGNGKTDLAKSMDLNLADWTDPKSLGGHEDWELFNIVRNGKGEKMPPEGEGRAKDTDVWNLIIYIRSFSKSQQSAPESSAK
jgi:mono/diheme cytochrome c family protein